MMSLCPDCGMDHHAADGGADGEAAAEVADAMVESAEIYHDTEMERAELGAEVEADHLEARTEQNADDNDTAEAIAQIQADAQVDIAEAQADAEVEQAQIIADAIVDTAVVETIPAEETPMPDAETAPPEGEAPAATPVAVPPQIREEDDRPKPKGQRTVSRFRAHRR